MCTRIVSQLNPEQLLTCPYDPSHRIRRFRIRLHLTKCRLNNPCRDMRTCPYNVDHMIPAPEYDFHCEICEDRIQGDRYRYEIVDDPEPPQNVEAPSTSAGSALLSVSEVPEIQLEDDWGMPKRQIPVSSINNAIQDGLREKKVMVLKQGATKSERKAHYMEERRRHNIHEDDINQPSTSRAGSAVPPNQPLRKPRTVSLVSTQSSVSTVIEAQKSVPAKKTVSPTKSQASVTNENLRPQQIFSLGRGRTPGNNKVVAPQPEPKVGVLSESQSNTLAESFEQFGIDQDGFCNIPIPSKGRGRKLNVDP